MPRPSQRAVLATALCSLAALPATGLAAGGFHCVPEARVSAGVPDPANPVPALPALAALPVSLTLLHAGEFLSPTAALIVIESEAGITAAAAAVASTGAVRIGKTFTYTPIDAASELGTIKVRLPGTGPCGRGACDLDAQPTATLVKGSATVAFACSEL